VFGADMWGERMHDTIRDSVPYCGQAKQEGEVGPSLLKMAKIPHFIGQPLTFGLKFEKENEWGGEGRRNGMSCFGKIAVVTRDQTHSSEEQ